MRIKCPTGSLLWRAGGRRKVGSHFPVVMVLLHIYSTILGTKVELFTALQQFSKPPSKKIRHLCCEYLLSFKVFTGEVWI